jgi:hypothetical protein
VGLTAKILSQNSASVQRTATSAVHVKFIIEIIENFNNKFYFLQ